MRKLYFLVILCLFSSLTSYAAIGCYGGFFGTTVYTKLLIGIPGATATDYDFDDTNKFLRTSTLYCITESTAPFPSCRVYNRATGVFYNSRLVTYLPINQCPLDDYIPYTVLLSGGLMYLNLKRLKFNKF